MQNVRRNIADLIYTISSKIESQFFWERVFNLSINGMNFGNGGDFDSSGELYVAKYIFDIFKEENLLIIFDVGANKGAYSKALYDVFGLKGRIYAFEPSKQTYQSLIKGIDGLANIVPVNIGFSEIETTQVLYTNEDESVYASVYKRELSHAGIEMSQTEEIHLSTIDNFCLKENIEHIHFLKLDIEGHELSALKGATNMIKNKKIDFIQFEFGGGNIDSRTYLKDFYMLLKNDFKLFRVLKNGIHELPAYKETYEIFATTNYLAIRK